MNIELEDEEKEMCTLCGQLFPSDEVTESSNERICDTCAKDMMVLEATKATPIGRPLRSGGKTKRAARMAIMNSSNFVTPKVKRPRKKGKPKYKPETEILDF